MVKKEGVKSGGFGVVGFMDGGMDGDGKGG